MATPTFLLNTGAPIPALGLGTWQSAPGAVTTAVTTALRAGYRHIDAAYCYGNEAEVGAGLKAAIDAGVCTREEVFLTTKLWCTYQGSEARVREGLRRSLENLGVGYVDLFLVHWGVGMNGDGNHEKFPTLPSGARDLTLDHSHRTTWSYVESLLSTGKVRAIGVSNYSVLYLKDLLKTAKIVPAVNQIENHPQLPQDEVIAFTKDRGIHVTAYSPFGSAGGPLLGMEEVRSVAVRRGVEAGTVLLSYANARGLSVLAKSVTPERIKANKELIKLEEEDLALLGKIKEREPKRYVYPEFGVNFGFPDRNYGIAMVKED